MSNKINVVEVDKLCSKNKVEQMMDFDSLWSEHEWKTRKSASFYTGLIDALDMKVMRRTLIVFSGIIFIGLLLLKQEPIAKDKNTSVVKRNLETQFHVASPYSSDQPIQLKSMVFSLED